MNTPSPLRRMLLRAGLSGAAMLPLLSPVHALAEAPSSAFEARELAAALKALGLSTAQESPDIQLRAPDVAENGAVVPLDITVYLPDVRSVSVLIDKNPFPLSAHYELSASAVAEFHLRVKMAESSEVRVIARTAAKIHLLSRRIDVTQGGCGA